MNILYTTNQNFLPQVSASIASVCENNRTCPEICFYILCSGFTEEDKEKMTSFVDDYAKEDRPRKVCYIDLEQMESYFDFSFDTAGWNPIILARLLMDRLLPDTVERVIYLDGDTIVRRSLASLWKTDLSGCVIGAVMEPTCSRKRKAALGLAGKPYYNSGVLLIDLQSWRRENTGREIIQYYQENGARFFAPDQDAINGSQKDRICPLSISYNYPNTYDLYRYRLLEKNCDYPIPSRKEFDRIRQNPHIIHYLGEERPWRKGNTHRFRQDYLTYLNKTPWAGQGLEEGWEKYFFCWRIFNAVMKPFPMTRLTIINNLIPFMLKKKHSRR